MKIFICLMLSCCTFISCKRGKKTDSIWDVLGPVYVKSSRLHHLLEIRYFLSKVDETSKSRIIQGQNLEHVSWFLSDEKHPNIHNFMKISRHGSEWKVLNEEMLLFERAKNNSESIELSTPEKSSTFLCIDTEMMRSTFKKFCNAFGSIEILEPGQQIFIPHHSDAFARVSKSDLFHVKKVEIWPKPAYLYVKSKYVNLFQDQLFETLDDLESISTLYRESELINLN